MLFFCSYDCTAGLHTSGVVRRGGGPAPPLVRVGCSRTFARDYTLPDDPHVDAHAPAVDSKVRNSYFFIYFCFFTIVIALGKLIFFQITRCRTSACCVVGRGGQATSWSSPGGAVDAVLLRRPADPRVHGPVATKDTHTFHFSVGEMTLSLEDGAMLGGLPCAGQAMGPIDIPMTWHTDFLARFTNVPRNDSASAPFVPFADTHGPTWTWIQQFRTWF
jgi:hypothetical protein